MRCPLLTACETAIIDAKTNNLSLVNILQDVNAPGFPALHQKLTLAAILDRDESEPGVTDGTIRITLDDQAIFESPIKIDFQTHLRVRAMAEIQAIVIPRVGALKLSLMHGDKELGSWTLKVNQIGEPQVFIAPEGQPPVPGV